MMKNPSALLKNLFVSRLSDDDFLDVDAPISDLGNEAWSLHVDNLTNPFGRLNPFTLLGLNEPSPILTEDEAHAIVNVYEDGGFVVFRKDQAYFLLAKVNDTIQALAIVTKKRHPFHGPSLFNLRNTAGDLILGAGVTAYSLGNFLKSKPVLQYFAYPIRLNRISLYQADAPLQTLVLRHLLAEAPNLAWLSELPPDLQDKALFIFLDTFIANIRAMRDIDTVIDQTLYQECPQTLSYRLHYRIDAIKDNLKTLRVLYQQGNLNAGRVLAALVYQGLTEPDDTSMVFQTATFFSPSLPALNNKTPILGDLEEYQEITQNWQVFPTQVLRDIFLLRYFKAKNDNEAMKAHLQHLNLPETLKLHQNICSNNTLLSFITLEATCFTQLTGDKKVLLHLITSNRLHIAHIIKEKLPKETILEKDESGRTILHTLIDYLKKHGLSGSYYILELFDFVCQQAPSLLVEPDPQGYTVYEKMAELMKYCDKTLSVKIKALTSQYLKDTPLPSLSL